MIIKYSFIFTIIKNYFKGSCFNRIHWFLVFFLFFCACVVCSLYFSFIYEISWGGGGMPFHIPPHQKKNIHKKKEERLMKTKRATFLLKSIFFLCFVVLLNISNVFFFFLSLLFQICIFFFSIRVSIAQFVCKNSTKKKNRSKMK